PDGIERAACFPVKEWVLSAAVGVHHLDRGVTGVCAGAAILAVEQLRAVRRERGKRFAQQQLEFRVGASGRNEVFGYGGLQNSLIYHLLPSGRPARMPYRSGNDR